MHVVVVCIAQHNYMDRGPKTCINWSIYKNRENKTTKHTHTHIKEKVKIKIIINLKFIFFLVFFFFAKFLLNVPLHVGRHVNHLYA